MGTWRLEVLRMALYVTFPVAMFHVFNNPEWFEQSVIKTKRELCPPENIEDIKAIEEMKAYFRKKREESIEMEYLKLKS